jgi:hypothetical protein
MTAAGGATTTTTAAAAELRALVAPRPRAATDPRCGFRLRPSDRPLVAVGDTVAAGDPLFERIRDPAVAETRLPSGMEPPEPGAVIDRDTQLPGLGRRVRFDGVGRVLYVAPSRRLRVAVGRHGDLVTSPVAGVVEVVDRERVAIRTRGLGLPGVLVAGAATHGKLVLAVDRPDGELPAGAINVGSEGAILVAGARLDVESLSRARAMGVRGIVTGGVVGRDLRAFIASEARQRAGLHTSLPFGLIVLDGFGKRPIPGPTWRALRAAAGQEVGIVPEPEMLVLAAAPALPPIAADQVRIVGGDWFGREARYLGLAGRWRFPGGVVQEAVRVELEPTEAERAREVVVALADLERFE